VGEQAEPPQRALALESGREVVGDRHDLQRRAEHELPRVQHEGLVALGLHERGQVVLLLRRVDVRVPRVVEHAEVAVETDVDARGLHQPRVVRLDAEATLGDRGRDVAVAQQHGAQSRQPPPVT
jgi:hypothetical protein